MPASAQGTAFVDLTLHEDSDDGSFRGSPPPTAPSGLSRQLRDSAGAQRSSIGSQMQSPQREESSTHSRDSFTGFSDSEMGGMSLVRSPIGSPAGSPVASPRPGFASLAAMARSPPTAGRGRGPWAHSPSPPAPSPPARSSQPGPSKGKNVPKK